MSLMPSRPSTAALMSATHFLTEKQALYSSERLAVERGEQLVADLATLGAARRGRSPTTMSTARPLTSAVAAAFAASGSPFALAVALALALAESERNLA